MTCDIKFIPVHWQKLANTLQAYIDEKRILVDAFWEDHVLAARHYIMVRGEETIGYFAIFEEQTLVLFNVFTPYKALSQELFARVKKMEKVTNALLPTGDEFFLSHCIDGFTRLEKQAYFACYSSRGLAEEKKLGITLRLGDVTQREDIETLSLGGGFLAGEIEKMKGGFKELEIYIAAFDGRTVGFGVIQYGIVDPKAASIGMYVLEQERQKGIGANILCALIQLTEEKGLSPRSGCWYYNHYSKKTMESAGGYSSSRLLRFCF